MSMSMNNPSFSRPQSRPQSQSQSLHANNSNSNSNNNSYPLDCPDPIAGSIGMGPLPIQRAYYNQKRKEELLTQILQDEDTIATLSALMKQDECLVSGGNGGALSGGDGGVNVNNGNANINANGQVNANINVHSLSHYQVEERSRYKKAKQEVTSAHGGTYELYRDFSNIFD